MSKQEDATPKLESQLDFPLYVVSRKVISFYQPYLKKLNLTYTQYIVLMALWENNNIPVCELGKVLFLDNEKQAEKKAPAEIREFSKKCFICENIEKNTRHLMDSAMNMWEKDEQFRELYGKQEYLCLPHTAVMFEAAERLPKKMRGEFLKITRKLSGDYLLSLESDTTHFCRMFDYRNRGADWGNSKDAIERSIRFITSRIPRNEGRADEKNR